MAVASLQFWSKRLYFVSRQRGGRTTIQYGLHPVSLSFHHLHIEETQAHTNEHFTSVLVKFRVCGLGHTPDWTSTCLTLYAKHSLTWPPHNKRAELRTFNVDVKFNISLNTRAVCSWISQNNARIRINATEDYRMCKRQNGVCGEN